MAEANVKSARRVFEFLEHFAGERRALSVAEIARRHAYPASSVSAILRTMVAMGYLSYNGSMRTYLPTPRLSFMVSWVGSALYREDRVRSVMETLSAATGETILLATQVGLRVQYVHIVEATGAVRLHATAGEFRPLLHSASGLALLSRYPRAELRRLVRRLNAEETDAKRRIAPELVEEEMTRIGRRGYALSLNLVTPGAGAIAVLLPELVDQRPLCVAIAGSEASILRHCEHFADLLKRTVAHHYESDG